VEATSEEMCQKLESLILADRRMKVSRLAEETGISAGAV
jgi:DNA-binding Xre family transcriptional regulator